MVFTSSDPDVFVPFCIFKGPGDVRAGWNVKGSQWWRVFVNKGISEHQCKWGIISLRFKANGSEVEGVYNSVREGWDGEKHTLKGIALRQGQICEAEH